MGVALVTGSSRGIGHAIATRLAGDGFDIAVTFHTREESATASASDVEELGTASQVYQLDVGDRHNVLSVIDHVEDDMGPVSVLVNNAGVLAQKPYTELSEADWEMTIRANLEGAFWAAQVLVPRMKLRGGGRIINIASSGGQMGGTLAMHYAASKAGLISLTKSLARVGAPEVLVNCVSPGLIETEMTEAEIASVDGARKIASIPLGRVGTVDDVAEAVAFLASDDARYVTGQTLNVNGGLFMG